MVRPLSLCKALLLCVRPSVASSSILSLSLSADDEGSLPPLSLSLPFFGSLSLLTAFFLPPSSSSSSCQHSCLRPSDRPFKNGNDGSYSTLLYSFPYFHFHLHLYVYTTFHRPPSSLLQHSASKNGIFSPPPFLYCIPSLAMCTVYPVYCSGCTKGGGGPTLLPFLSLSLFFGAPFVPKELGSQNAGKLGLSLLQCLYAAAHTTYVRTVHGILTVWYNAAGWRKKRASPASSLSLPLSLQSEATSFSLKDFRPGPFLLPPPSSLLPPSQLPSFGLIGGKGRMLRYIRAYVRSVYILTYAHTYIPTVRM